MNARRISGGGQGKRRQTRGMTPEPFDEAAFQEWYLPERKRVIVPASILTGILSVALVATDPFTFGVDPGFGVVAAIRVGLASVILGMLWILVRSRRPAMVDRVLFATWALGSVFVVVIHGMQAPTGLAHQLVDMLLVLVAYMLPNRLPLQVIPAVVLSISAGLTTPATGEPLVVVIPAYVVAHAIGIVVSRSMEKTARTRFQAFQEIRALRGIIPICATCKRIRDDQGFWSQVEEYITRHSEALFSHGMCPECTDTALEELGVMELPFEEGMS
ncbi:MAG: hypothetical protein OEZ65_10680 [Gemmatimonadota bacterium]|nr:hypothetical protein [Gemmatimonadota bacterium]MDH5760043.1 hypothetical protein [Gemmatimonadota bacterium]